MLLYFPDEGLYEMSRKRLNFYVAVQNVKKLNPAKLLLFGLIWNKIKPRLF